MAAGTTLSGGVTISGERGDFVNPLPIMKRGGTLTTAIDCKLVGFPNVYTERGMETECIY